MTALLTAVLAIGVLAGCSEKTPGNAGTSPTTGGEQTSSTPTSEGSSSGLSIAKFVSKPCDILTAAQVGTLGSVATGKSGTNILGAECMWDGQDVIKNSSYSVSVTEDKDVEDMVSSVKSNPIFQDKTSDGVRIITNDGSDGTLHCSTIIEVSKTDSVTVYVAVAADERPTKPACPESEKVTKMVIENLRG